MRLLELQLLAGRRLPHHRDLVAQQVLPQCAQTVVAGGRHRCSAHVGIVTPREVAVGPRLVGGRHVLAAGWIEGRRDAHGVLLAGAVERRAEESPEVLLQAGGVAEAGAQVSLIVAPDRRRPVVAVEALRARELLAGAVTRVGIGCHLLRRRLPVVHGDGDLRLADTVGMQGHLVGVGVGVGDQRPDRGVLLDRHHVAVSVRRQVGRAERTEKHARDHRGQDGPSEA